MRGMFDKQTHKEEKGKTTHTEDSAISFFRPLEEVATKSGASAACACVSACVRE